MSATPTLQTERLLLRSLDLSDALRVQALAGDRAIADTTLLIPHPYEDGMAEEWIERQAERFEAGEVLNLALVERASGELVGVMGLTIDGTNRRAELGYWVGRPHWNQGLATEAGQALLGLAFTDLGLNRVFAICMTRNPASARVLRKLGLRCEGLLRQEVRKWDRFEDVELYALLREEWVPA